MDNNVFVSKLIKGTKEGIIKWEPAKSNKLYNSYQPFFLQNDDKKLVLEKYNTTEYDAYGEEMQVPNCKISICDDQYNSLSDIYETDVKKSSDLMRLYRLAERQANNVDEIMENFVKKIEIRIIFI